MSSSFRSSVWDPVHIIFQILTMQSIYYVWLGVWICIMDYIAGTDRSLDQMFSYQALIFKDLNGRLIMGSFVLNALTCAIGLWYIIKRTKQCLDFTITVHFVHLLVCWIYNHTFPATVSWWLVNIICIVIMTVLGEFLCMRTELKAIPISVGPKVDL
ncbi:protein SYS1 homolog [Lineus longissimus]|uniref:protein SYS1 homolog n=1 Tax=Lineus longissimus TaxID=88925 RepID=UPI002B4D7FF2